MNRESAIDCRADIQFQVLNGAQNFQVMPGRWASKPQPLPMVGHLAGQPIQLWDQNIFQQAGTGISIPPGESELLDIASRFDDEVEAYGWSNLSYQQPLWRNSAWKLEKGCYIVVVTVRAGGQKWMNRFTLNNDGKREEMLLEQSNLEIA
jgi:hypothetical protein